MTKRYCKKCQSEQLHDLKSNISTGEKTFIGLATLGMIPLFEFFDDDNGPHWGKYYKCQRCDTKTKV